MRELADLHRHLDGSLRLATANELARALRVNLPEPFHFAPGMGLAAALALFRHSLALLQTPATVKRVAREMCEDATAEGVTTLEIRFAPQLHQGGVIEAMVDAALEGADGQAGIILCGLYGEEPAVLERLVTVAAARPGVVGIDLAGGPHGDHRWGLADYRRPFARARDIGLGRTVHAGEGRPAEEIRVAVTLLHAQRIGHGTTVLDDPSVVDLLCEREVTLEACPTSNVHTGVIAAAREHPLRTWLARGLRVAVCADNTLFSQTNVALELTALELSEAETKQVVAFGHAGRFVR